MLNLVYLKGDAKIVFHNADSGRTLVLLYLLKYTAYTLLLFSLATNITRIEKIKIGELTDFNEKINNGVFVSLPSTDGGSTRMEDHDLWSKLWTREYKRINPFVDINIGDESFPVLLIGRNANSLVPESILGQREKGIYIICPKKRNVTQGEIKGLAGMVICGEDEHYETVKYDKKIKILYVDTLSGSPVTVATDPIIILYTNDKYISGDMIFGDSDVIYKTTENKFKNAIKHIDKKHRFSNDIYTDTHDFIEYKQNIARQILYFLSSFCTLILIADAFIIMEINNLEYKYYGMEYAIKKIMGYSVFQKNKRQIILNNGVNIIIAICMFIIGYIAELYSVKALCSAFIIMIVLENLLMIIQIGKIEKTSVKKILKGGCL